MSESRRRGQVGGKQQRRRAEALPCVVWQQASPHSTRLVGGDRGGGDDGRAARHVGHLLGGREGRA